MIGNGFEHKSVGTDLRQLLHTCFTFIGSFTAAWLLTSNHINAYFCPYLSVSVFICLLYLYLSVSACFFLFLPFSACFRLFLPVSVCICLYLSVFVCFCLYLSVSASICVCVCVCRIRVSGIRGLQGVVRKTVDDELQANIWEPRHMEQIVPALLVNLQKHAHTDRYRPADVSSTEAVFSEILWGFSDMRMNLNCMKIKTFDLFDVFRMIQENI